MSLEAQLKNPLVQQYVLEIALPLVGYFFFDWSITIIIAFYFIDYFGSEIARHRRHYKIMVHWNGERKLFVISIVFAAVLFCGLSSVAYLIITILSIGGETAPAELLKFFKSEGWFLIPLVYFANYMKDTMVFYAPRRFTKYNFKKTLRAYALEIGLLFILATSGLLCWSYLMMKDIPALILFIVVKLAFDLILVKKLQKYSTTF